MLRFVLSVYCRTVFLSAGFIVMAFGAAHAGEEAVLTWQDCVRQAQKNNPSLIAAEADITVYEAREKSSASSRLPQVEATAGAATSETETRNASGEVVSSGANDNYTYGLSGSQLIFDGGKSGNAVRAARENVSARQQAYRFVSADVRLNLRNAFIDMLKAQELVVITQEIFAIRRKNVELLTLRYYSGLEHRGALLVAEAEAAEARLGTVQAQRALTVNRQRMLQAMGSSEYLVFRVEGDFSVATRLSDQPDFETIISAHPTLRQQIFQKRAAEFQVKSTKAEFWPQVTGRANAGRGDEEWPPAPDEWGAGINVSLPLFEGGSRHALLNEARALLKQVQANEQDVRDTLRADLEEAWATMQNAVDAVAVQQKMLAASEERSRIAESQYTSGFITYDNWAIIENNLVTAKRLFLDVKAVAMRAEAQWIKAKGETLEYASSQTR